MRTVLVVLVVLAGALASGACVTNISGVDYDCTWSAPNGGVLVLHCEPITSIALP